MSSNVSDYDHINFLQMNYMYLHVRMSSFIIETKFSTTNFRHMQHLVHVTNYTYYMLTNAYSLHVVCVACIHIFFVPKLLRHPHTI